MRLRRRATIFAFGAIGAASGAATTWWLPMEMAASLRDKATTLTDCRDGLQADTIPAEITCKGILEDYGIEIERVPAPPDSGQTRTLSPDTVEAINYEIRGLRSDAEESEPNWRSVALAAALGGVGGLGVGVMFDRRQQTEQEQLVMTS